MDPNRTDILDKRYIIQLLLSIEVLTEEIAQLDKVRWQRGTVVRINF